MKEKTKMQQTAEFGSDWWNDSNDHVELQPTGNIGLFSPNQKERYDRETRPCEGLLPDHILQAAPFLSRA